LSLQSVNMTYYGSAFGLTVVDLNLSEGETLVVYGREGSGKSTLLRIIAKLEEISSGEILLKGINMRDVSHKELNFGYTFGKESLDKRKTVGEIIAYPMLLREYSQDKIGEYLEYAEHFFDLDCACKVSDLNEIDVAHMILARLFSVERQLYLVDDVWKDLPLEIQSEIVDKVVLLTQAKSAIVAIGDVRLAEKFFDKNRLTVAFGGTFTSALPLDQIKRRPQNMESAILCGYELHIGRLQKTELGYYAELEGEKYPVSQPISDIYVGKEVCFALDGAFGVQKFYYDKNCERIIAD